MPNALTSRVESCLQVNLPCSRAEGEQLRMCLVVYRAGGVAEGAFAICNDSPPLEVERCWEAVTACSHAGGRTVGPRGGLT